MLRRDAAQSLMKLSLNIFMALSGFVNGDHQKIFQKHVAQRALAFLFVSRRTMSSMASQAVSTRKTCRSRPAMPMLRTTNRGS